MQVSEVYNLMKSWEQDPCWDLEQDAYDTKYAPYRQILLDFAKEKKACWKAQSEKHEKELRKITCPILSMCSQTDYLHCITSDCALWDDVVNRCGLIVRG